MLIGMLWILGIYGTSVLLVHWILVMHKEPEADPVHYVFITKNNELQVEWMLRMVLFFTWLRGEAIRITIADEGSVDQTLEIAGKMRAYREGMMEIIPLSNTGDALDQLLAECGMSCVVVHMNGMKDLKQITAL
ncbi:hypothetical protein [Paenibacillus sp. y28]|uniref:hypothetical protein n=1 Tax=Paenibacillus sp. y28 TaxID=3129110 RepID=UPI0030158CC0